MDGQVADRNRAGSLMMDEEQEEGKEEEGEEEEQSSDRLSMSRVSEREVVRVRLVSATSGRTICFPGVTTQKNAWTLDARRWLVRNLIGHGTFSVENESIDLDSFSTISCAKIKQQQMCATLV